MRVLIYSESAEAIALRDGLRGEGHHASIRNPQYFNPAQFDQSADEVYANDAAIRKAYEDAGFSVKAIGESLLRIEPDEKTCEIEVAVEVEPEITVPKRKRK